MPIDNRKNSYYEFGKSMKLYSNSKWIYEIINIIENYSNVIAFINGHNHSGNYILKNGIHYISLKGMVNTSVSSYSILEIYKNKLMLKGFGNQKDIFIAK